MVGLRPVGIYKVRHTSIQGYRIILLGLESSYSFSPTMMMEKRKKKKLKIESPWSPIVGHAACLGSGVAGPGVGLSGDFAPSLFRGGGDKPHHFFTCACRQAGQNQK